MREQSKATFKTFSFQFKLVPISTNPKNLDMVRLNSIKLKLLEVQVILMWPIEILPC